MPRPRVHDLDRVLDAAERLAVAPGPESLTIRGLSAASGVPNGAIYHAFGSLAEVRGRMWLRAAREFLTLQSELIDAALGESSAGTTRSRQEAAVNAVVAAADTPAEFARRRPDGARLLMTVRRERLLGPELSTELADALLGLDQRLVADVLCRLASALWARRDGPSVEVMTTCVVDLPTAILRRTLAQPDIDGAVRISDDLRARLDAAVRAVLAREPPPSRSPGGGSTA